MSRQRALLLFGAAWLCALGAGECVLVNFASSPGSPADAPPSWPSDSQLQRTPDAFDLVVFAHPRCPCTRATLGELAVLMARCSDRVAARVVFFKPPETADDWAKTDLWRAAEAIPGVTVATDEGGIEASRFGARTSGQVFLYDPEGRLRFQGGITPARGHEGDNTGRQAIDNIVHEDATADATNCVFGCPLHDPTPTLQRQSDGASKRNAQ